MLLYRNLKPIRLYKQDVEICVTLEGEELTCVVKRPEVATDRLSSSMFLYLTAEYNGERKEFIYNSFSNSGKVTFPLSERTESMTLYMSEVSSAQKFYYDGTYLGTTFTVNWQRVVQPASVHFAPVSLHEDYGNRLTWTVESPESYPCCAAELLFYEMDDAGNTTCTKLFGGKNTSDGYVHAIAEGTLGKKCWYRLTVCTYPEEYSAVDQYLSIFEMITETYTVDTTRKYPASPPAVVFRGMTVGGYASVSWEAAVDSFNEIVSYELERQINGGSFALVYRGDSTTFADRLTGTSIETAAYRVRSVDAEGEVSEWTVSETLAVVKSNVYVMSGGELRGASGMVIGGYGAVSPVFHVG